MRTGRVELTAALDAGVDSFEPRLDGSHELRCPGCRLKLVTDADEQGIIELGTKPFQGHAHRGATQSKLLRRPRSAPLADERRENQQQIQVKPS